MTTTRRIIVALVAGLPILGCAPRLRPLPGAPAPAVLPRAALPDGYRRLVFRWELEDADLAARGEGAARMASPDSVRLDFFLSGGMGSGAAILISDDLRLPPRGDDIARRVVPPAPLLWAALGRLAVPPAGDTTVRVDADTLRADIGAPIAWRVTFVKDSLRRLERVDGGRVVEWVDRSAGGLHVRYRNETSRRQLELFVSRFDTLGALDPSIWVFQ